MNNLLSLTHGFENEGFITWLTSESESLLEGWESFDAFTPRGENSALSRDCGEHPSGRKGRASSPDPSHCSCNPGDTSLWPGGAVGGSVRLRNCCSAALGEGLGVREKSPRLPDQLKQFLSVPRVGGEMVLVNLLVSGDWDSLSVVPAPLSAVGPPELRAPSDPARAGPSTRSDSLPASSSGTALPSRHSLLASTDTQSTESGELQKNLPEKKQQKEPINILELSHKGD